MLCNAMLCYAIVCYARRRSSLLHKKLGTLIRVGISTCIVTNNIATVRSTSICVYSCKSSGGESAREGSGWVCPLSAPAMLRLVALMGHIPTEQVHALATEALKKSVYHGCSGPLTQNLRLGTCVGPTWTSSTGVFVDGGCSSQVT